MDEITPASDQSPDHSPHSAAIPEPATTSVHALIRNLGGHESFLEYQKWFRGLYCNPNHRVKDVLGRRVTFDNFPSLDDCAHVCYGGKEGHAYKPEFWNQKRAERIAWIGAALTNPNEVHPDSKIRSNEKYLLYVPAEPGIPAEQYVVITREISTHTMAFVTAFCIGLNEYQEAQKVFPRIYPRQNPRKRKR